MIKSVFPFPGSKSGLVPEYIKLFRRHSHFVDVFGGSGCVILGKKPSTLESFNDVDGDITNLFRVIKDDQLYHRLQSAVDRTHGQCQPIFEDAKKLLASKQGGPVDRALALLVVLCQCMLQDAGREDLKFGYGVKPPFNQRWPRMAVVLQNTRNRFQFVQVFQEPWQTIIGQLDSEETFFFCDPPYLPETLTNKVGLYKFNMTAEAHAELLTAIKNIKGRCMICGYATKPNGSPSELYNEALARWSRREWPTTSALGKGNHGKRTECVWMNYKP